MVNGLKPSGPGEFLFYQTEDGRTRLQVRMERETVWLSQRAMAQLFQTTTQNVSLHIQNIFDEGELTPEATVKKYLTVQTEGARQVDRHVDHYNLDVIISVGYRVKSLRGTQFRISAAERLPRLIAKGFTMDDGRVEQAEVGDHFDELLDRIRDIRSSPRAFWRRVLHLSEPLWSADRLHHSRREHRRLRRRDPRSSRSAARSVAGSYKHTYTCIVESDEPKPLRWIGSSRKDLQRFPEQARRNVGHALFAAQQGSTDPAAKPLKGFGGAQVMEIVERHDTNAYRVVYATQFADTIIVLHAFQKKSTSGIATPKHELDLIRTRLTEAGRLYKKGQN